MKKIITTVAVTLLFATFNLAQIELNHYEVEILDNPNPEKKDTREVNATFLLLKLENDNYRLIKAELMSRKIKLENNNEEK